MSHELLSLASIRAGRHYAIFSDGACPGNPGPGGWGLLLQLREGDTPTRQAAFAGYQPPNTTNVRMEMTAALKGLSKLPPEADTPAVITMDNKMIVEMMTLGGFEKWKATGWWRGTKPLPNADLWEGIDKALGARDVHWQWVRGHAGHPENEIADMLASNAAARRYMGDGRSVRATHEGLFF
ncbi:RNase H family protein [Shinella sumterensis]|nr:RNase H family protein [Shinella sumterensis]